MDLKILWKGTSIRVKLAGQARPSGGGGLLCSQTTLHPTGFLHLSAVYTSLQHRTTPIRKVPLDRFSTELGKHWSVGVIGIEERQKELDLHAP